jgi:cysteine desulfurase
MNRFYLDHNASSPLASDVADALRAAIAESLGNPGGVHWHGQKARALVERTRRQVAQRLGTSSGTVTLTSGATEANNTLVSSLRPGTRVLVSRLEHASVLESIAARTDLGVDFIPNDGGGSLDLDFIRESLSASPAWVFVCAANNELGNRNPVEEIAELASATGSCLHVDAVQVFGRIPWAVPTGCTSATVSAHKAGGPMGTGALWVDGEHTFEPILRGGAQERGRRAGTENTLALAGFSALLAREPDSRWQEVQTVRDAMEGWLKERFNVRVNGTSNRLPNTLHCSFPDRDAEEIVMALDLEQVSIAAGAACSAGSNEISHVVRALSDDVGQQRGGVRISFGPEHAGMELEPLQERFVDALT